MKIRYAVLAALGVFFVLGANLYAENGLDRKAIDAVREKEVLSAEDAKVIDDFIASGIKEILACKDFTKISNLRTQILIRSKSEKESAKTQYAVQFTESAAKHLNEGLAKANELTPKNRMFKVKLNLLILADNLENPVLVNLAIPYLKDESPVIQYWAVHTMTNPVVMQQLNASKDSKTVNMLIEQLKPIVESASAEMLGLMVQFAGGVDVVQGEELLMQIADARIKQYEKWTVENEAVDANILGQLCKNSEQMKPSTARRFAQLYSYAIQRYIKSRDKLSAEQKNQLATVLVETEKSYISKLTGTPQTFIKRAVEQDDYSNLALAAAKLLGDGSTEGELPVKLKFDYGKEGATARMAPLVLPDVPGKTEK